MNIPRYEDHSVNTNDIDDPTLKTKEKFRNCRSIQLIKCHCENKDNTFCFSNITHTEIEKEIKKLDSSKSSPNFDNLTKILKDYIDIFTHMLQQKFNKSLELGKFSSEIKLANVTSVIKKEDRTKKKTYRPTSILSNLSKVFKRCFITNFLYVLIRHPEDANADLEKALILCIV